MKYIDAHMHVWDTSPDSVPAHSAATLGPISNEYGVYLMDQYIASMQDSPLELEGVVFVEALSSNPLAEAQWVQDTGGDLVKGIVAYANLADPHVETLLAGLSKIPKVRGIRQILNHHDTDKSLIWPKVEHSQYLQTDAQFKQGYALLEKYRFSFDLHINPHQLEYAAAFVAQYPNTPVIIDHVGCLHLTSGDALDAKRDDEVRAIWLKGMQALAALPHVYCKLSMLQFVRTKWWLSSEAVEEMKGVLLEVIHLFGSERCLVASNMPVDNYAGLTPLQIHQYFVDFTRHLPLQDQENIFFKTAKKVYRI